jgi:hypothetical protein
MLILVGITLAARLVSVAIPMLILRLFTRKRLAMKL